MRLACLELHDIFCICISYSCMVVVDFILFRSRMIFTVLARFLCLSFLKIQTNYSMNFIVRSALMCLIIHAWFAYFLVIDIFFVYNPTSRFHVYFRYFGT